MFVEAPKAVGRWIGPLVLMASVAAAATDLRLVDAVKNRDRPESGSPMTYVANGKQYIVIATSGGSNTGELVAYRLP